MKKRNFLCGFALSLTALVALGSCGMNKVTPEEGMKAYADIKSAYENNQVIYPAAFTITDTVQHTTDVYKYNGTKIYSVDASNNTFYSSLTGTEKGARKSKETWLYYEDGYFYSAIDDNGTKSYTKKEVKVDEQNDHFVINSPWLQLLNVIGEGSFVYADKVIGDYNNFKDSNYIQEHYKDGEISSEGTFRSNGEGSFGLQNTVTLNKTIDLDLSLPMDGYHTYTITYEDNILSEFTIENEKSSSIYSIYDYESVEVSLDSQFKKPNLSRFNQEA